MDNKRIETDLGVSVGTDQSNDDDKEKWKFGLGAGYYIDATEEPWSQHYQMFSYVNEEFIELLLNHFNVDATRTSIFG